MDKARDLLRRQQSYEPINADNEGPEHGSNEEEGPKPLQREYSWLNYAVFFMLGIAMLWAWNMFLAAAPYFQHRFRTNKTILTNFQAAEVSISTVANLGCMLVLTKLQANAHYPRRIATSLILNIIGFTLLALSTKIFTNVSAVGYFVFAMITIFASSTATGFMQNGAFSYAAGLGRPEYLQAIMTGQAVAGVLPPIVQIASVLSAGDVQGEAAEERSSTSAMVYFFTATGVSAITLLAFVLVAARRRRQGRASAITTSLSESEDEQSIGPTAAFPATSSATSSSTFSATTPPKSVPLLYLLRRLFFSAGSVFLTFAITMVFPVFTQEILSTSSNPSRLLRPASFIPFAFLIWNLGDLIGRLIPLYPRFSLSSRPRILLSLAILRMLFIPLYLLCNIDPAKSTNVDMREGVGMMEAKVKSELFYLLVVQFPFGLSNGYLGSCAMMGAGGFVEEEEREAAGSFMGLSLVSGLAVGSLCSFFVGSG